MLSFSSVILIKKNGDALLQKRDNIKKIAYPNFWSFPGGTIEKKETAKNGAKRELFEETGYLTKKLKFFKNFYDFHRGRKNKIVFFWDYYDNSTIINCFEGQKLEFISFERVILKKYLITSIAFHAWVLLMMKNKIKIKFNENN